MSDISWCLKALKQGIEQIEELQKGKRMSQIMGLPADKLLEEYTPGEKIAYTFNSGYQAAIADVLEIINSELEIHMRMQSEIPNTYAAKYDNTGYVVGRISKRVRALTEGKE